MSLPFFWTGGGINRLQDSINHLRQTEAILGKNYDQYLEEKEQKFHQAKAKEHTLYQWLFFLIPVLDFAFVMIFLLYAVYKKSRREVKQIALMIIKNHFLFKDKTKVYINDLLYVKAEDHYIRGFTSDWKNHLVRGKLGNLEDQLPPNFMRTHRSYLTNRNFVRQIFRTYLLLLDGSEIPISRSFKNNGHKKSGTLRVPLWVIVHVFLCFFHHKSDSVNTGKHL